MSVRACFAFLLMLASVATAQAATHQVQVFSFGYTPKNLTIAPGDTVVWNNTGGSHNVQADDGSFSNGQVSSSAWTFSRVFNTPGEIGYFCTPHGGPGGVGMSGKVNVVGAPPFAISPGITGTWSNPATPGQGFELEVVTSSNIMVFGWFTWSATTAGVHDWLSGLGTIAGNSVTVDLQRSSGGRFNDPTPVTTASVGTATFRFTNCQSGTVTFNRTDNGQSGTIPIQRLTPVPSNCTAAVNAR